MASSNQGMKRLIQFLGQALGQQLDLWTPFIPADNQLMSNEMRLNVLKWLATLNDTFDFNPETLFLSVDIFDRFLHRVKAQAKYLKCIAVTCLYLAAKVSEEDENIPMTWELVRRSECGCSEAEVLRMERCILNKLDWNVKATHTSFEFFHLFYALVQAKCPTLLPMTKYSSVDAVNQALFLSLTDPNLLSFAPSTIALTFLSLFLELTWVYWLPATQTLQAFARLSDNELSECRQLISQSLHGGSTLIQAIMNHQPDPRPSTQVSTLPNNIQLSVAIPSALAPLHLITYQNNSGKQQDPPSLPVTPHPPAKRRKVEQDDDVYDDIRTLYDSEEAPFVVRRMSGNDTDASSVTLSCSTEVLRFNGVISMATRIATI